MDSLRAGGDAIWIAEYKGFAYIAMLKISVLQIPFESNIGFLYILSLYNIYKQRY